MKCSRCGCDPVKRLEKSEIAFKLLEAMGKLFGKKAGGLGISVIVVGALLAASTGIVGATVVTMGLISLPVMIKAGYSTRLSSGLICASGTLGQIIPPSIVLVLLADILQGANEQASELKGELVPDNPVTAIDLFAGALLPGLLLVGLYLLYQIIIASTNPSLSPALIRDYQNDRVINEKKESVKFDEKQSFPQFSLNVSNPISWKLMLLIMLMQLLTEGFALIRILQCMLECGATDPCRVCGDIWSAQVECGHGVEPALSFDAANQIGRRYTNIFEID